MKFSGKTTALASALALGIAAGAAIGNDEKSAYDCGGQMMGNYPMGMTMPMAQMQAMMQQGRSIMQRMVEEPDRHKRQELMQQHMESMHGQMMGRYMNHDPAQMQHRIEMMNQRMDRMQEMMEQMQQEQAQ